MTTRGPDDLGRDAAITRMLTAPAPVLPASGDSAATAFASAVTEGAYAAIGTALADADLNSEVSEDLCAAIEEHAEAVAAGRAEQDESDAAFDRHVARQQAADKALRETPVRTLADLRAKLTYLVPIMAPDMAVRTHVEHLKSISDDVDRLCRQFGALELSAVAVARMAPYHPGMLPYPAEAPTHLLAVDLVIKNEAERLHGIALAEFERRRGDYSLVPFRTEAVWSAHLRRKLLLDALAAATCPEHAEPAGDDRSRPGFVLYEDAGGTTHCRPVADWIGFMAQRLRGVAHQEFNRAFNAACNGLTQDECRPIEERLRRDLRLDAIFDLVHRPVEVFEASREYAVGARWRYGEGDAAARPGPSLLALGQNFDEAHALWLAAVEANREPSARYEAHIAAAKARGRLNMDAVTAAGRLPGVEQADAIEQAAFDTVSEIGLDILRRPARSVADLAVQARGAIPLIWGDGSYEADAGPDEDINNEAVRLLIESCCAVAGVDWRGRLHGATSADPVATGREIDRHDYAFHAASTELRLATRDHERLVNAADDVWVEQNGGDTSEAAMAPAIVARDAASARQEQAWRDLFKIRPRTWHQLWLMLRDVAEHFDSHQGMVDEPDVFGSLIGAVNGLRISSTELTATHDLSLLSINELEYLADICRHQSRVLAAFVWEHSERALGLVLDTESNRLAILGDHARGEIVLRRPSDDFDRDLRLESMIKADLAGNGYVEPALLAEAVAAWGTR